MTNLAQRLVHAIAAARSPIARSYFKLWSRTERPDRGRHDGGRVHPDSG